MKPDEISHTDELVHDERREDGQGEPEKHDGSYECVLFEINRYSVAARLVEENVSFSFLSYAGRVAYKATNAIARQPDSCKTFVSQA